MKALLGLGPGAEQLLGALAAIIWAYRAQLRCSTDSRIGVRRERMGIEGGIEFVGDVRVYSAYQMILVGPLRVVHHEDLNYRVRPAAASRRRGGNQVAESPSSVDTQNRPVMDTAKPAR